MSLGIPLSCHNQKGLRMGEILGQSPPMERSVTRKDGPYTDWVRIAMLLLRMCNN